MAGVHPARHPRQRPGARPGADRRRRPRRRRAGPDQDLRATGGETRRQGPLRAGDRAGAAGRARWTWRCTPPRTCPASCPRASRSRASRRARTRATPSSGKADSLDEVPEGARIGTSSLRRARPAAGAATGPGDRRTCGATSTRASASWRPATSTGSCWPRPACGGSGRDGRDRVRASTREQLTPAAGPGRAGARVPALRRPGRAPGRRRSPTAAALGDADLRARRGRRPRGELQHARSGVHAELTERRADAGPRLLRPARRQRVDPRRAGGRRERPRGARPGSAERMAAAGAGELLARAEKMAQEVTDERGPGHRLPGRRRPRRPGADDRALAGADRRRRRDRPRPPHPRRGPRRRPARAPSCSTSASSRATRACPRTRSRSCWSTAPAQGKIVVRLKGGDPFVFGRGGEEAEALAQAGIPFEVVPGVTAGVAARAYAGHPRHPPRRRLGRRLRHRPRGPGEGGRGRPLDYERSRRLPRHARLLHGREGAAARSPSAWSRPVATPAEPAAVIERGTLPGQRTVSAPLAELAGRRGESRRSGRPAITVVGPVAARREAIAWFERRPLHGVRVVVTRARAAGERALAAPGRARGRARGAARDPDRARDRHRRGPPRGRGHPRLRPRLPDQRQRRAPAVRGDGRAGPRRARPRQRHRRRDRPRHGGGPGRARHHRRRRSRALRRRVAGRGARRRWTSRASPC